MASASFSVFTLPRHAPDPATFLEWSSRLKALRLKSLKSDPNSWIAVFEDEVDQDEDFWLKRLKTPKAVHLILAQDGPERDDVDETTSTFLKTQWAGFVVIVMPEHNARDGKPSSSEYVMSALYVDADFRGRGLGKRLVQATLETVKNAALEAGIANPFCTTAVRHGNARALQLYQTLGFQVVDSDHQSEKEGRSYTSNRLKIDLSGSGNHCRPS